MPDFIGPLSAASRHAASNAAASRGISVASNGTPHTKATSWTEMISATSHAASWLIVAAHNNGSVANLFDIGVGGSTSEVTLIPDLYMHTADANGMQAASWLIPVSIPAGTRISARAQDDVGGLSPRVVVIPLAPTLAFPQWCSRCEALGVTSASTRGKAIDPGGTIHTDAITEIAASTSFPYKWLNIASGLPNAAGAATAANWLVDICVGGSGSEVPIVNDLFFSTATAHDSVWTTYSLPCAIPAGSRVSARARCSINDATDRILDLVVYGSG